MESGIGNAGRGYGAAAPKPSPEGKGDRREAVVDEEWRNLKVAKKFQQKQLSRITARIPHQS